MTSRAEYSYRGNLLARGHTGPSLAGGLRMRLSRGFIACCILLFMTLLCVPFMPAQEARWNELTNLVLNLCREGKTAEALPLANEALKLAETSFGPDDERVATTLNNLGHIYDDQGKYSEAEPFYLRSLRIREHLFGPDHAAVASVLNNLAELYFNQSRYVEAESLYLRALRIFENVFGSDDTFVSTALNNLASLYDYQGRYAEAEPLFQRALRIDEKASGPESAGAALDLNNLATLYFHQGRYAESEPLLHRVMQINEKALGPDHRNLAATLNNLAHIEVIQGKYSEAELLYQRALRIFEKTYGPDHPAVASALSNLAGLYVRQGKYAEAEPMYQHALRIREVSLGPDHTDVAISLNNLAALYVDEGKYGEAEPMYQRALRIFEKTLGPDHPNLASALDNLAQVYLVQGKIADAEPLYQRALRIQEKALGPEHPGVATALNNLALLYDHQRRYAEAEPLYRRALRIDQIALGPEHPELITDLNNLALLFDHQGKYSDAEPLFHHALDNLFQQFQYNFTYMTEKERLGFLATVADSFPVYFSFVYRNRDKSPQLIGSMYNLLLWEKGFIAGSIADMRRAVEASGDAEALKLLGQLTSKRTQIAALLKIEPPDRTLWRKQIDQLRAEANDIEKALVARSSVFAERKKLDRATWQQVRDALKPGEAAVEFAHFDFYDMKWTGASYYAALVVTHETTDQPEYIFLGDDKQIEGGAVARFQQAVRTRGSLAESEAEIPGEDAYQLIWKPLEKALAGKTRIYLSPDGILNQLPLGIIPAPNGKLQMERYDLRLLSSTRDILRAAAPHASATALLVGDPVFNLTEDQQISALQMLALPRREEPVQIAALTFSEHSRDMGNGASLVRLPGTGAEVNAIAEIMKQRQWKTSVYTNELALKRVVEQASSPRVVHLATHGFFLPDQQIKTDRNSMGDTRPSGLEDPMLRAGLYFAGADRTLAGKPTAEGLDNGVMTAMEAGNLNLRETELVVLSACNTGQGDVKNGEGVFGLRRALQEAGAQEVLMSLWSVPDQETLELMKRFYTKWLSGMEMHQALKNAQLEMRESVRLRHNGRDLPYYWGAFVLVGR